MWAARVVPAWIEPLGVGQSEIPYDLVLQVLTLHNLNGGAAAKHIPDQVLIGRSVPGSPQSRQLGKGWHRRWKRLIRDDYQLPSAAGVDVRVLGWMP